MRPIRQGDRGSAVEDVQRRLLALGYDLGPTGVDGVFLGTTRSAVQSFQRGLGLAEDGNVGDETWSALVDATFALGDRMLYLRSPLFHGHDVEVLQRALNTLGFGCGEPDGIFGRYSERAVRDFQQSSGLPADGIVGADTVRAILNLKHVWLGKEGVAPAEISVASARAAQALARAHVEIMAADSVSLDVAERLVSLALAAEEQADISVVAPDAADGGSGGRGENDVVVLHIASQEPEESRLGLPVVVVDPQDNNGSTARVLAGLAGGCKEMLLVVVDTSPSAADERALQRAAVAILDGLCASLA